MTCASCSGAIENYFGNNLLGIIKVNVSLLTNKAIIKYDYDIIKPRKIIEEIEDLGFEAELQPNDQNVDIRDIVKKEVEKYRKKLVLCACLYIPISILIWIVPYSKYLKGFMTVLPFFRGNTFYIILTFLMSSVIQFYMGMSFYNSAYKSLKHKSANMDVLIVIGTTAAWFYGFILIFIGYSPEVQHNHMSWHMAIHSHVHNFETSSVLILIVLLGKYIESFSKMKTVGKLSELASLKVSKANLVEGKELGLGCKFREVAVELLEKKDHVIV